MEQSSLPFSLINSQLEYSEKFAIFRVRILSQIATRAEIILVSPPIKEMIGLGDPHDLQSWFERIHPEHLEQVKKAGLKAVQEMTNFDETFKIFHSGREEWRWVRVLFTPELDDQEKLTFLNGFVLDINFRNRVEEWQTGPVGQEEIISSLITRFINIDPDRIDKAIFYSLKKIGEYCRLDHGFLLLSPDNLRRNDKVIEWFAENIPPFWFERKNEFSELIHYFYENSEKRQNLIFTGLAKMPPELSNVKALLKDAGIESLAIIPIFDAKRVIGILGFDKCSKNFVWERGFTWLFNIVSEIFINALANTLTQKKAEEIETLLQTHHEISAHLEMEPLLGSILEQLKSVLDYSGATIFSYLSDRFMAVAHRGAPLTRPLSDISFGLDKQQFRQLHERKNSVIIAGKGESHLYSTFKREMYIHFSADYLSSISSWVGFPMFVKGQLIGVLSLEHVETDFYNEHHAELARSFARQAALSIENALLFQAEQTQMKIAERRRRTAESLREVLKVINSNRPVQEVLDFIVQQASHIMGENIASAIYQYEMNTSKGVLVAQCNLPQALTDDHLLLLSDGNEEAVKEHRFFIVKDIKSSLKTYLDLNKEVPAAYLEFEDFISGFFQGYLGVPLVVREEIYGVLIFYYPQFPELSKEEIDIAMMLGDQAALAIENARLFDLEQKQRIISEKRRKISESLWDLLKVINSNRSEKEVLEYIAEKSCQLMGDRTATAIYNYDLVLNKSILVAGSNLPPELQENRISPLGGVAPELIKGEPFVLKDLKSLFDEMEEKGEEFHPEIRRILNIIMKNFSGYLGIPLKVRGEVYGGLVFHYPDHRDLDQEDIDLGMMLGDQAALALENASLIESEAERGRELQTLLDIAAASGSTLSLEEMLEITLQRMVNLVGASRAGVILPGVEEILELRLMIPEEEITPSDLEDLMQACGQVMDYGEPLYVSPDSKPFVESEPGALLPLRSWGKALGVLAIFGKPGTTFTTAQMTLFESIGDQLGVAVENAKLYEQAEENAVREERGRLARDLHDSVTQTLFSATMIADVLPRLWDKNQDVGKQRLEELRELTRGALAEMRTLLLELRPSALVETEFSDLLVQLADAFKGKARVPVSLKIKADCQLPEEVNLVFYRITQEALNNIAKHSHAKHVNILLECEDHKVSLVIADDGRGFDLKTVPSDHLGLGFMRERAETIQAELKIESCIGDGTCIVLNWLRS